MIKQKRNKLQQGWTTMEFLITFPLLFGSFLMIIHYGLVMKTKLSLTNATNAAAQALARSQQCSKAIEYFNANFDHPGGAQISCSPGESSEIRAEYTYPSATVMMIPLPAQRMSAKSVAMGELP